MALHIPVGTDLRGGKRFNPGWSLQQGAGAQLNLGHGVTYNLGFCCGSLPEEL
jgi:hypothetical protein